MESGPFVGGLAGLDSRISLDPAKVIDLRYIIPGKPIGSIPDTIPSQISRAYLSLSITDFALGGTIKAADKSDEQATKPAVPQPILGEVQVDASYSWGKKSDFSLELGIIPGLSASASSPPELDTAATLIGSLKYKSTKLEPEPDPKPDPKPDPSVKDDSTRILTVSATEAGAVVLSGQGTGDVLPKEEDKDSREWELSPVLENLYATSLVEFFDPDIGKHVIPLIDSIVLDHLDVTYKYSKTGDTAAASEFTIKSSIRVAAIVLTLDFYHKGFGNWGFSAIINPQSEDCTLGDVIHSMLSDTAELDLPAFVSDMKLMASKDSNVLALNIGVNTPTAKKMDDKAGAGTSGDAGGSKEKPADLVKFFYLIASINIGELSFTFAQIHSSDWEPTAPSKRLFRAKVDLTLLPPIHVELIRDLKLPLDDMYYIWSQDKGPPQLKDSKDEPRKEGFTRADLDQLNSIKPFEGDEILVKDKFKEKAPADLLLAAESYFGIIGVDSSGDKKVCMAGARLHASFSVGPILAWFDAFADFLINYKPFYFIGHVSIAVGVSFNIDFLFIHTHISVEIGAELTLWGLPLAGTVHVDLWVASFSIDFGAAHGGIEDVNLYEFYLLVLPTSLRQVSGLTPGEEEAKAPRPPNEGHNFVATSGLVNTDADPKKPKNAPWNVKGGLFCFVTECKMPVRNV